MTTQYTSTLKLALPVQGELSGTWGDVVNDNITSMVEQAIAGRAVIDTWTTDSHTLTVANGTTSESRCAMLELTDTGTALTGAGTVICPTASKIYIVKNAAGQNITVKTAAGTGILVPNGRTTFLFCDGTNVVEAMTHTTSLQLGTSTTVTAVLDEDNMASDSATALATQQSIKAYVDAQVGANNELSEVLANGNTSGANDIIVDNGQKITVDTIDETTAAAGVTIDSVLLKDDGVNATNLEVTNIKANDGTAAATIADSTGVVTVPSAVLTTADINGGTADGVVIGGTTPAAATVTTATANTSLNIAGTVTVTSILDEDNMASDDPAGLATQQSIKAYVDAQVGTADELSEVLANGNTTGGNNILFGDDKAIFGAGSDLQIYHDGSNSYISDAGTGNLIVKTNGNNIQFEDTSGNDIFKVTPTATNIYHGASGVKLATTSTGIDVTGTVTADGLTVDGLAVSDGVSNGFRVVRGSSAYYGQMSVNYEDSKVNTYIDSIASTSFSSQIIFRTSDSSSVTSQRLRLSEATGAVFNVGGGDYDFRVESDNYTHALFVDAGAGIVSVFNDSPVATYFQVGGDAITTRKPTMSISGGDSGGVDTSLVIRGGSPTIAFDQTGGGNSRFLMDGAYMYFSSGTLDSFGNNVFTLASQTGQETVFNQDSLNLDFRVESDSNSNMLFVDAGNNRVGVNTGTPGSVFDAIAASGSQQPGGRGVIRARSLYSSNRFFSSFQSIGSASGSSEEGGLHIGAISDSNADIASGCYYNTAGNYIAVAADNTKISMSNGLIAFYAQTGKTVGSAFSPDEIFRISSTGVTVNEQGYDRDFRVESDNLTHALFVDAVTDRVSVGSSSPTTRFYVNNTNPGDNKTAARITGGTSYVSDGNWEGPLQLDWQQSSNDGYIRMLNIDLTDAGSGNQTNYGIYVNGEDENFFSSNLDVRGSARFNENGGDNDFRVESSNNSNMFVVDAAQNQVGVGSAPDGSATLDAVGRTFRAANIYTKYSQYSVPTATYVDVYWNDDTITLDAGYIYRFQLATLSTGTNTGVIYWVWFDDSVWHVDIESRHGTSSNNPQGRVDSSKFQIFTNHGSTYTIGVHSEARAAGTDDNTRSSIGLPGFITAYADDALVFNEGGHNTDFRVESDSNAYALFVDAGNSRIGINDSDPQTDLHIGGGGNIRSEVVGGKIGWGSGGGSPWYSYIASSNDGSQNVGLEFFTTTNAGTANINHLHMHPDNGTIFNEGSADLDFRVKSDTISDAFTVDGGTGVVSANGSAFTVGNHSGSFNQDGTYISNNSGSFMYMERSVTGNSVQYIHRRTSDGNLIEFHQGGVYEGSISVAGTTVSYNGFCGTHDSSGATVSISTPVGTVLSTIDEEHKADHAKVKVSDSVGDKRVYGVLQQYKETTTSDDTGHTQLEYAVVASVGIASVRVTGACEGGDLLESNGDGTAKVQSDDIVRSKTLGKVTIGNSDTGVKLVSCVMYCG